MVQVTGTVRVIDLRPEQVLDQLDVDDRINTVGDHGTWCTCQELGDRLRG